MTLRGSTGIRLWRNRVLDTLADPFWHLAWRLRGLRACPRCGLTWEPPAVMERQGGVCHDCEGDDIVRDLLAADCPCGLIGPHSPDDYCWTGRTQ